MIFAPPPFAPHLCRSSQTFGGTFSRTCGRKNLRSDKSRLANFVLLVVIQRQALDTIERADTYFWLMLIPLEVDRFFSKSTIFLSTSFKSSRNTNCLLSRNSIRSLFTEAEFSVTALFIDPSPSPYTNRAKKNGMEDLPTPCANDRMIGMIVC